jgi:hypothetical protein
VIVTVAVVGPLSLTALTPNRSEPGFSFVTRTATDVDVRDF